MANIQVTGFIPYRRVGGGTISYKRKRVLTNNTTAIFKYDAVKDNGGGDYLVASATNTSASSVAVGAIYTDSRGVRIEDEYLPAATLYTSSGVNPPNASFIYVVDNLTEVEFKASIDEAIALTGLGLNYVMVLGTGSTTTKLSGHELDATGAATTATFPWRVTDFILGHPDSDPDLADAHVIARMNLSFAEPALSAGLGN